MSSEMIWIILANTMSCSYCFYQIKSASSFSSLSGSLYWYEAVKSIDSQRKIRRQWGLIFSSQVLFNSGKKSVIHSSPPISGNSAKGQHSTNKIDQMKNSFDYHGTQLVKILDSFVLLEAKTLLSTNNLYQHWHDLTGFSDQLRNEIIQKDKLCTPSLYYGNYHVIPPSFIPCLTDPTPDINS